MPDVISNDELLARFITSSKWYHKIDRTVKQDAFMPQSSELSVTRHLNLTAQDIWTIGQRIVEGTPRTLHGRADVEVTHVRAQELDIIHHPELGNPNHAHIVNWPQDKAARKERALQIARLANFIANPEGMV